MKNIRYFLSAVLAMAGLASCNEENLVSEVTNSDQEGQQMLSFVVNVAEKYNDTRSKLDENGKTVLFNAGDAISVLEYGNNYKFTTAEGGKEATFTGEGPDETDYFFLSPYQSDAVIAAPWYVIATLPSSQQAVAGSYDPEAMLCVGSGKAYEPITLYHACALIKIKVAESLGEVQSVSLSSSKPIAGRYYYYSSNGNIDYSVYNDYNTITLNGPLAAGYTYYICVLAKDLDKITVSYSTATNVYERTAVNPLSAQAGHIYDFGELNNSDYSLATIAKISVMPNLAKNEATSIQVDCDYTGELPTAEVEGESHILGGIGVNIVWEVYDSSTKTLHIRTKASSILLPAKSSEIFTNYEEVTTITGLDKFDTSIVKHMENMFSGCIKLTTLPGITGWNTTNVVSMSNLFFGCNALTGLDLSGWNTGNVESMYGMFDSCYQLETIKFGEGFTLNKVTEKFFMFSNTGKSLLSGKCTISGVNDPSVKSAMQASDTYWNSSYIQFASE